MDIAPDKALFFKQKVLTVFLILIKNICCGYSLEVPQWVPTTYVFMEKQENYFVDTPSYLELYMDTICMEWQILFYGKDKKNILKCCLLKL